MIYLIFTIITAVILLVFLYQLQSFLVFDPKIHRREKLDARYTYLEIQAEDGTLLEGMEYTPQNFKHTIFYLGGRSQDCVALIHKLSYNFEDYRILTFNYRGYGNSKGVLDEKNIFADALHVAKKFQAHYGEFSIVGFSLGSSVAAYVASKIKVEKLFLLGGFDSVANIFKSRNPLIPAFMVKYTFDTALHVSAVDAKTYLVSSADDDVVPLENAHNLKSKIKNLAEYKELSRYNHDEILFCDESVSLVKRVLN
ncbi:alpha/beta hydrolase [bacterium]|nr:alpha/beta hydrolase [bacterium]MBU1883315.1 alpha/beta hydrolase [bacterium]